MYYLSRITWTWFATDLSASLFIMGLILWFHRRIELPFLNEIWIFVNITCENERMFNDLCILVSLVILLGFCRGRRILFLDDCSLLILKFDKRQKNIGQKVCYTHRWKSLGWVLKYNCNFNQNIERIQIWSYKSFWVPYLFWWNFSYFQLKIRISDEQKSPKICNQELKTHAPNVLNYHWINLKRKSFLFEVSTSTICAKFIQIVASKSNVFLFVHNWI